MRQNYHINYTLKGNYIFKKLFFKFLFWTLLGLRCGVGFLWLQQMGTTF